MVDPVLEAAETAPEDDEPISEKARKALKKARQDLARGRTIPDGELEKHLAV